MDYADNDWNTFAKSLSLLPDDMLRVVLNTGSQGEAALQAWEDAWAKAGEAFGMTSASTTSNNRMVREIMAAFYKAEGVRRGLLES